MSVAPESGRNLIMIYGPKDDGTYIVEFRTAAGEALFGEIDNGGATRGSTHLEDNRGHG